MASFLKTASPSAATAQQTRTPPAAAAKLQIDKQNADTKLLDVQAKHQLAHKKLEQDGQIAAAGLAVDHQKNAIAAQQDGQQQAEPGLQPDPYKEAELHLKHRKQNLEETRLAVDTHNAQAALDSKESVEAFKFATTAMVHPEAAPVGDNQLAKVGDFIDAAAAKKSASDGGVMEAEEPSAEAKARAQDIIRQLEIERALHSLRGWDNGYSPYLQ